MRHVQWIRACGSLKPARYTSSSCQENVHQSPVSDIRAHSFADSGGPTESEDKTSKNADPDESHMTAINEINLFQKENSKHDIPVLHGASVETVRTSKSVPPIQQQSLKHR